MPRIHAATCLLSLGLPALLPAQEPVRVTDRGSVLQVVEPDAQDLDLRMTPVVRAVQRAADSVVSIYLQNANTLTRGEPVTRGQGSGVILDESGLVITNWHVIWPIVSSQLDGSSFAAEVKLRDGRARRAVVLSHSKEHDLALLQVQLEAGEKVQPIEIARSSDLMIGETLIAIGNPQGHANTVTTGVLSATERTITVRAPDGQVREFAHLIQTDAAINHGNSGGALLDITGKLVGINNAMAEGAENIGFAIPMDLVREVFETELSRSGNFALALDAPWLGLEVVDRGPATLVSSVLVDSPADRAGIEAGDVLTRVRDHEIRGSLDYQRQLIAAPFGEALPLRVRRADRDLDLAPVPTTRANWFVQRALGCTVEEVKAKDEPDTLRRATLAYYSGSGRRSAYLLPSTLRVSAVEPGSPAEGLLEAGDLVFACVARSRFGEFDRPLESRRELLEELGRRYGGAIKLAVARGEHDYYITLDVRSVGRTTKRD
ncbi:MAG: trypsin-like peptidase domain-containing protein [Planctomycetes bacterium]|nr:trypsin-like peptidase domain-containing protein [Planctomycetota bacterium]